MTLSLPVPSINAIGGVRVSTDQQTDKYGPERQRSDIHREAARAGLDVTDWVEETVSGANDERAAENRYYELARQYPGLNVIFSHPSRVGRHVEVTVGIARRIHALGGTVYIAGIGSLRDRRNWKEFLRDAVDAESDYSNLIYNLNTGKDDKARRNRWPHGPPPWGYVLERDHRGQSILPVPVPELVPAIRRLYDLAEQGGETFTLDIMRAEGWPARSASGWEPRSLHGILTNSAYMGVRYWHGIRIDFEPIITPEQWYRVQAARQERGTHAGAKGMHPLLLTGFARCALCDRTMVRGANRSFNRLKNGERSTAINVRYYCTKAKSHQCPHRKHWSVKKLDAICWQAFTTEISDPVRLAHIAAPLPSVPKADTSGRMAELRQAIERAWRPFIDGRAGYTEQTAEKLAAPHALELAKLEAEAASAPVVDDRDFVARAREFTQLLAEAQTQEQRRQLLRLLQARFYVGTEGLERLVVSIP
ncbi:recombinase family protein [Deinococcus ruber]|uniref:Recombinase domain-containing protein n=1 Tax=Deinococcus ruber TaxID=1848197 RepID=A0A918CPA3_9DEIO|nr:recombinase family protein [Deinococcus ruber]GGR33574.1 hypothetical protein GCM10008957_49770 [Deinococcus ruber]